MNGEFGNTRVLSKSPFKQRNPVARRNKFKCVHKTAMRMRDSKQLRKNACFKMTFYFEGNLRNTNLSRSINIERR